MVSIFIKYHPNPFCRSRFLVPNVMADLLNFSNVMLYMLTIFPTNWEEKKSSEAGQTLLYNCRFFCISMDRNGLINRGFQMQFQFKNPYCGKLDELQNITILNWSQGTQALPQAYSNFNSTPEMCIWHLHPFLSSSRMSASMSLIE